MGTTYYGVVGFGINLQNNDEGKIDVSKAISLCRKDLTFQPICDCWADASIGFGVDLQDFIELLADDARQHGKITLDYADAYNGQYLIYIPRMPWQTNSSDRARDDITEDQMRKEIADIVEPYLAPKRDRKWLEENISYVSTYGWYDE